jgi:hypothetical protein
MGQRVLAQEARDQESEKGGNHRGQSRLTSSSCSAIPIPWTYLRFLKRFMEFTQSHKAWVPHLREVDGEVPCSEDNLWDKVFYGLAELKNLSGAGEVD